MGVTLKVPAGAEGAKTTARPEAVKTVTAKPGATKAGGRVYVVKKGDTLSEIAQRELKSSRRAGEILKLNGGLIKDANDLRVGMELKMPA